MCGIVGLITANPKALPVPQNLKSALSEIQHRGYDGAGLVLSSTTDQSGGLAIIKNTGLIEQALPENLIHELNKQEWQMGLAHTRYKTSGNLELTSVQPLISKSGNLALVHNGHLNQTDCRPDSLQILQIWEKHFDLFEGQPTETECTETECTETECTETKCIETENQLNNKIYLILKEIFQTVEGSYSCLVLIKNIGLVAFRDPHGIRPLILAHHPTLGSMFASETIAFNHLPDNDNWALYDVDPGVGIFLQPDQLPMSFNYQQQEDSLLLPCLFEYIYLAHPDSVLNGLSVRRARRLMGQSLAQRIKQEYPQLKIDLVVPVPDSSCIATQSLAQSLNLPYHELLSLISDKPCTRSFILPTQEQRETAVRQKFRVKPRTEILMTNFKNLLLVDDSIVRGTTMKYLIHTLRLEYPDLENIYVASIAPVIRNANRYGIDIPEAEKLLAYQRTIPEITKLLGADLVIYQDLEELEQNLLVSLDSDNLISGFEDSMFK